MSRLGIGGSSGWNRVVGLVGHLARPFGGIDGIGDGGGGGDNRNSSVVAEAVGCHVDAWDALF